MCSRLNKKYLCILRTKIATNVCPNLVLILLPFKPVSYLQETAKRSHTYKSNATNGARTVYSLTPLTSIDFVPTIISFICI